MRRLLAGGLTLGALVLGGWFAANTLSAEQVAVLRLGAVDSARYPEVRAEISALNAAGFGTGPLSADMLTVRLPDGTLADAARLRVIASDAQPVGLAIAIDLSMAQPDYDNQIRAAQVLIDGLRPTDTALLISYADTVSTTQPATSNKAMLRAALAALTRGGAITTQTAMLSEAARRAASLNVVAGRRVLVFFTDSGDTSQLPPAQAIDELAKAGLPVRAFGFGTRVKSGFAELEKSGNAIISNPSSSAELPAEAARFLDGFGKGYQLQFYANTRVNDAEHGFGVELKSNPQVKTEGRYTAKRGLISVDLSGVPEGRFVDGTLSLASKAIGQAAITSVEFLVDGTSVGVARAAPYSATWNSQGASAGEKTFSVRATDAVGNVGEFSQKARVPEANRVTLALPAGKVVQGNTITANLDIAAAVPARQIEVIVDDVPAVILQGNATTHSIDTRALAPGPHVMKVRLIDTLGRVTESTQNFEVEARPLVSWPMVLAALGSLGVLGLGLLLMSWLMRRWRDALQRDIGLEIRNAGNVACRYLLLADAPGNQTRLTMTLNGSLLQQQSMFAARAAADRALRSATMAGMQTASGTPRKLVLGAKADAAAPRNGTAPARAATATQKVATRLEKPSMEGLKKAQETAGNAVKTGSVVGSTVGDILSLVGAILPGQAGRSIASAGSGLRQATYTARRVNDLGERATEAGAQVKNLGGQAQAAQKQAADARKVAQGIKLPARDAATGVESLADVVADDEVVAPAAPVEPPNSPQWSVTPPIAPGSTLLLNLNVQPVQAMRGGLYNVTLQSQAIEGLAFGSKTLNEQFVVGVGARSIWRKLQPLVQTLAVLGLMALAIIVLLRAGGVINA